MKRVLVGTGAVAALVFVPHLFLIVGAIAYTGVAVANAGKTAQ